MNHKIENCCISSCDSSTFANNQNITYFTFPTHDEILLKKWLMQIGGWRGPKSNLKICSLHFLPEDIDNHPNRKQPVLKTTAVPKLYLRETLQSAISKSTKRRVSVLRKTPKTTISRNPPENKINTVHSVMQSSITLPTIIHQLPKVDAVLSVPYVASRFRKILPKLDPIVKSEKSPELLPAVPQIDNLQGLSSQNPYIIIIPRIDNSKSSIPNNTRLPNLSKRKPILRITINKEYNNDESNENSSLDEIDNDLCVRKSQLDEENDKDLEQIEIKNYKLNRSVIFSLDSTTGEIFVTKRDIHGSPSSEDNFEVPAILSTEKSGELKDLCIKSVHDVNLAIQRLDNLPDEPKDEYIEIVKLQKELASLNSDSSEKTFQSHIKNKKRKISEKESSQVVKRNRDNAAAELNVLAVQNGESQLISSNECTNSFSIVTNHSISKDDSITEKHIDKIGMNFHGLNALNATSVAHTNLDDDPPN